MSVSTSSFEFSNKRQGLLTGYSIILMALIAGFVYGFVHKTIHIPGDFELTAKALQDNFVSYKLGLSSWILIFILDIIVSIGIYGIYKDIQKKLAVLTSGLRVIYTLFLGGAVVQLSIPLVNSNERANSLSYFDSFEKIWSLGLIIFGFHLLSLGAICFKSKFTPKFWNILLSFGGVCYILVHTLKSFFPHLSNITSTIESVLITPMALSEIGFAVWLIVKATRLKKSEN